MALCSISRLEKIVGDGDFNNAAAGSLSAAGDLQRFFSCLLAAAAEVMDGFSRATSCAVFS